MNVEPNRVREIFVAAARLGPEEWDAHLNEACGGDNDLLGRVRNLLEAHRQAGSFLQAPAAGLTATFGEPVGSEKPGTTIGQYKLLQEIGEGGMGTVFLAEQTHPVQRKVAIKLIKSGMDSQQVIARFEAERQALALMDHPNIARVLDAGTTENGRPYFVMELVKGVPITKYCDEHHLTPKDRLELFVPVCQAVQHAHQKGIIHRDLKPSNVMVCLYDGKPVPKVIDFGVAKATGPRLTERTLFTEIGSVVGTLEYMSPEQAELNQLDIDTRSDIYSLGVLLYELLTGTTPLERKRFKAAAFLEVLRLIREEESPRPSTRLSTTEGLPSIAANRGLEPKKLSGVVRGELDWIVMKALDKDRNRRYGTASGFAADVQRYLTDETVHACPPSAPYRFRKFARRNQATLTTTALLAAALVLGAGISLWQAFRANDALNTERETRSNLDRERNEKEKQKTRINQEISDALVEAAGLREKARAAGPTHSKSWGDLRETAKRAEALAGNELADPLLVERVQTLLTELKQNESDRRTVAKLEEIRFNPNWASSNGIDSPYVAVFRDHGLPVLDMKPDEAAKKIADSPIRDALVIALDDWAKGEDVQTQLLTVATKVYDDPWRRTYFDARLRKDHQALVKLAKQPETLEQAPALIMHLAWTINSRANYPAVVQLLRNAQARHPGDVWINFYLGARDYLKEDDGIAYLRTALALRPENPILYHALATGLMRNQHYDDARALFEQCLRLRPDFDQARADYQLCLGRSWEQKGKLDDAIGAYKEALRLGPRLHTSHQCLIDALVRKGAPAQVILGYLPGYMEVVGFEGYVRYADLLRGFGKVPEAIEAYAEVMRRYGDVMCTRQFEDDLYPLLIKTGRLDEAIVKWRKDISKKPQNPFVYLPLCTVLEKSGRLTEALAAWEECIKGTDAAAIGAAGWVRYGDLLARTEKLDQAATAYRRAIQVDSSIHVPYERLGGVLEKAGHFGEALRAYQEWIRRDPTAPSYASACRLLDKTGRLDEAVELYREAVRVSPHLGNHSAIAASFVAENRLALAILVYREIIRAHPGDVSLRMSLAQALEKHGLVDEAIAAFREGARLEPKNFAWHQQIAITLGKKGRPQEAADAWRTTIRLQGGQADSYQFTQFTNALIKADMLDELIRFKVDSAWAQQVCDLLQIRGLLDQGVAVCRKLIALRPDDVSPYITLALALDRQVKHQDALAAYTEWIRLQPKSGDALVRRGQLYQRLGQHDKALADFFRATEVAPEWAPGIALALAQNPRVKPQDALAAHAEWIRLQPRSGDALVRRGQFFQRLGQHEKALADFSRSTEVAPEYGPGWTSRGNYYASLGQWEKAASDFSKLIELNAKDDAAWSSRGNAYFQLKQWDKAAADLTQMVELSPYNAVAWVSRGAAFNNLGQYEKGVADNSRAIEVSPTYALAWINRAWALERLGRWAQAADDYAKVIELSPRDPSARAKRAQCYSRLGRFSEEQADHEQILKLTPTGAAAHNDLAWFLATCPEARFRDPAKAVEIAGKAVKLAPQEGAYQNTLGVARYRKGEWQAAVEALTRSMELRKGGDGFDWLFLAMAHEKLGNKREARKWYDQSAQWLEKNKLALAKEPQRAEEFRRFRTEADQILDLKTK